MGDRAKLLSKMSDHLTTIEEEIVAKVRAKLLEEERGIREEALRVKEWTSEDIRVKGLERVFVADEVGVTSRSEFWDGVIDSVHIKAISFKKEPEMAITTTLIKLDNGYRAMVHTTDNDLIAVGTKVQNRKLHDFPYGSYIKAVFTLSAGGKKMLKSAEAASVAGAPTLTPVPKAEVLEGYYINQESRLVFNTALGMSRSKPERAIKIMMVGGSGYGKTTTPRKFAEAIGYRFMRMNCATIRDPEEWFGFREARHGSTVFIKSEFAKAIEQGDLVVVLDEFNRLEPWLHNTLFPLLDDDGRTVVHEQEFRIGPNVVVVGTINTGYKYTGTFELDEALMNRFDFVLEVGPMPVDEEINVLMQRTHVLRADARKVVKMANILRDRDVICSTRSTLLIANMVMAGMTTREAFESVVVRRLPVDNMGTNLRKTVVDQLNSEFGPCLPRQVEGDIFSGGVVVVEEEQKKVELPKVEGFRFHVQLQYLGKSSEYRLINVVKLLRTLPTVGGELSLADAKKMADDMKEGMNIGLGLTEPLTTAHVLSLHALEVEPV